MSRDDCEVVRYRPGLESEIARLQQNLWSTDVGLNARYFDWKYKQNPYAQEPNVYLASIGGRVVGMRGFYGSRWEHGSDDEPFCPLVADDMVVDPSLSNRRLVSRVMAAAVSDLADRGCTHLLNLSGGTVTVLASLAMGWKSAGMLGPLGWTSKKTGAARGRRHGVKNLPVVWRFERNPLLFSGEEKRPFRGLDRAAQRGGLSPRLTIARAPKPQAMAELIERLGHDGRIRHVRNAEYLAWKYRNPLHEYRFIFCGGERLEGYVALQRSVSDRVTRARVRVVDFEAIDDEVRAELLRFVVERGKCPELYVWAATMTEDERNLMAGCGFEPADTERAARGVPCILVKPLAPSPGESDWRVGVHDLLQLSSWDLRLIYSMAG